MSIYFIAAGAFCIGIVAVCLSVIFVFGYEIRATRYHGIFWCSILLYMVCQLLYYMNLVPVYFVHTNLLIPVFYIFFLCVFHYDRFKKIFLLFLFLPVVVFIIIQATDYYIITAIYHFAIWTIVVFISVVFLRKNEDDKKNFLNNAGMILIIFISVAPFIILSFILFFVFKKSLFDFIMFPNLAIAIIIEMFFIHRSSLVILNYSYYENLEMLKRQSTYEKKSIIEKLSSALIHEIKNPLSGIQSLAQQITSKKDTISMDKVAMYSSLIIDETRRIREMTNSYLQTFKKNINEDFGEINLEEEIKPVLKLIENTIKDNEVAIAAIFNGPANAVFNAGNFRQIMLNLIYNSIEANASSIMLEFNNMNGHIEINIRDNGDGINEAFRERIFDTFFSTKNEGTGIGLSICKEILNNHEGNIELVRAEKGQTELRVL